MSMEGIEITARLINYMKDVGKDLIKVFDGETYDIDEEDIFFSKKVEELSEELSEFLRDVIKLNK